MSQFEILKCSQEHCADAYPLLPLHHENEQTGVGIALGVALGTAIGAAVGNVGIGVALGAAFGIVYGAARGKRPDA